MRPTASQPPPGWALRSMSAPLSLDDLRHGDAELVLDQHHLAARHQTIVDVDVDRLADLAVELEHRARAELEQLADLHARASEHGGHLHRHVEHGFEVGGAARRRLGIRGEGRLRHCAGIVLEIGERQLAVDIAHCSPLQETSGM